MSVMYCDYCHRMIDEDRDCEHFTSGGECVEKVRDDLSESGLSEDDIERMLEEM